MKNQKIKQQIFEDEPEDEVVELSVSVMAGLGEFCPNPQGEIVNFSEGKKMISTIKKVGSGKLTDTFLAENDNDQIKIFYALKAKTHKHKKYGWISRVKNYEELAKRAFGLKDPDGPSIKRAKAALYNLQHRTIEFDGAFLDYGEDGKLEPVEGEIRFQMIGSIHHVRRKNEIKKSLRIHMKRMLIESGVKHRFDLEIYNLFKKDIFTGRLYLWLLAQFWNRDFLYPRKTETLLEEFNLLNAKSSYSEPKYFKRKLKQAILKINSILKSKNNRDGYKIEFIENDKIKFLKERIRL